MAVLAQLVGFTISMEGLRLGRASLPAWIAAGWGACAPCCQACSWTPARLKSAHCPPATLTGAPGGRPGDARGAAAVVPLCASVPACAAQGAPAAWLL